MRIIHEKWRLLQSTKKHLPIKVRQLYGFGLSILSGTEIISLRANARLPKLLWNTAKSKAYRLTKNRTLLRALPGLFISLVSIKKGDFVCLDISDFQGFQALLFAKQTRKGRAEPLYFEILCYPVSKGSQNLFIIEAIINFTKLCGIKPILVMDRGFACPAIIRFLEENQYKFVLRVKKCKHFLLQNGRLIKAGDMRRDDQKAKAWDCRLRLIVSDKLKDMQEPWYLATNMEEKTREEIVDIYYHRFEIEEFFRDAKRLLGLEYVKVKKKESLAILLWFALLSNWVLCSLADILKRHCRSIFADLVKAGLSRVRISFELLRIETYRGMEGKYLKKLCG
jgi:hypothetical protein